MADHRDGFWVFAYGSLMWNPGFEAADKHLATLRGYRRSFCMSSIVYRGTPEAPGLVLALDAGENAECTGVAYRVGAERAEAALDYLRARELVSSAYLEISHPISLHDGRDVQAICYVMDRNHGQYCGALSLDQKAEIISSAHGPAGPNRDYLLKTVASLNALGLIDEELHQLALMVQERE